MIQRSDLSKLRLMAFFQTMANVAAHLRSADLSALQLKDVAEKEFFPALSALDEALKQNRTTGLTEDLLALDARRDLMVVRLGQHLAALQDYPKEEVAKAAARLQLTLQKYGKAVQNLPAAEETAVLHNLVQDFSLKEASEDLKATMTQPWVEEMKATNEEYQTIADDRTRKEAQYETGKTKEARMALQNAFTKVAKMINALALVNGEEPYATLSSEINQEVANAMQAVKQRATRAETKRQSPNP